MAAIPKVQEPSMEEILASIRRIMADDETAQAPARPRAVARPDGAERVPTERSSQASGDTRGRRPVDPVRVERRPPLEHSTSAPLRPLQPEAVAALPQRSWLDEADEASLNDAAAVLRQSRAAAESSRSGVRPAVDQEPVAQAPGGAAPREPRREASAQARPPVVGAEPSVAATDAEPQDPTHRRDLLSPNVDAAITAAFRSLGDVLLPQKERTVEDLVKEILRPMLKDWLNANLPDIVEELVRAEIERVARRQR